MDTNPYFGGGVSSRVVGRDGEDLRDRHIPWDSSNNSGCDLLDGDGRTQGAHGVRTSGR